jgi:hypothetical protein
MDQTSRPLTDRDRAILDFERTWWTDAGCSKEQAIRDRLGLSTARYYEVLNALLDVRAAMDYDPLVIRRRRRSRDLRRRARYEGPGGKHSPSGPLSGKHSPSGPLSGKRGRSAGPSAR